MKEERKDVKQGESEAPLESRRRLLRMTAYAVPTIVTLAMTRKSSAVAFSPRTCRK